MCFLEIWILKLGLTANVDTECIPNVVPKPGFTKVDHLVHLEVSCVVIDLETTGLSKYIYIPC